MKLSIKNFKMGILISNLPIIFFILFFGGALNLVQAKALKCFPVKNLSTTLELVTTTTVIPEIITTSTEIITSTETTTTSEITTTTIGFSLEAISDLLSSSFSYVSDQVAIFLDKNPIDISNVLSQISDALVENNVNFNEMANEASNLLSSIDFNNVSSQLSQVIEENNIDVNNLVNQTYDVIGQISNVLASEDVRNVANEASNAFKLL